jgi:hypothetical protein
MSRRACRVTLMRAPLDWRQSIRSRRHCNWVTIVMMLSLLAVAVASVGEVL